MSKFTEMVAADRDDIFLNLDEFGERHRIEGKTITAVLDESKNGESGADSIGLAEYDLVVFAKSEDLPKRRPAGESLNVDGREFSIVAWREDCGIAEIQLAQQTAG